jgi:DNA-directed RNA polymerase specialized sigma24 family protein
METMATAAATDLTGVIASASAGDEVAFAMIVADHHEDMRRVCAVVCGDEAIAEEAAQAAWRSSDRFRRVRVPDGLVSS